MLRATTDSLASRVRWGIFLLIAAFAIAPTIAQAWTPTTPQISVSVFSGTENDYSTSIAVDGSGNNYTTGYFTGTIDLDPGAGTTNVTSAGATDMFVSKLNASGNLDWVRTFGNLGNDVAKSVAIDGSGNIYITGYFSDTVDFDPGAGTTNLTSTNHYGAFVSKLDSSGNLVWARAFVGSSYVDCVAVTVDGSGNIYTAGYFIGTADFDPGAGTTNLTSGSGNGNDMYVSKLNASGNLVWARTFEGTGNDFISSVAVDSSGNIYTTGYFQGTIDLDPGAGTTNLTSAGSNDMFMSKLNASGNLVWARTFGDIGSDVARSIAVDSSGNSYTTGNFNGTVDFDPGAGTTNLTSVGDADPFISKLDTSGNLVWARAFGGTSSDFSRSIAVDSSGNTYTTGQFQGTVDFDPGVGTANQTSRGSLDAYVSKLNASGNLVWARTFGGTSSDIGVSVAVDSSGNTFTTGYFNGTTDFDPGAGTSNLTSSLNDVFVLKLDATGNVGVADTTPPTATWTSPSTPSSSRTLSYTLTFSEAVSGIAAGDFQVLGTATGCVVTPSATSTSTSITVTVTCTSDGTVALELLQNSVVDGNSNTGPSATASASQTTINTPVVSTTTTTPTTTSTTTTTPATSSTTTTTPALTSPTTAAPSVTTSTVVSQRGDAVTTNTTTVQPSQSGATTTSTSSPTTTTTTQPVLPDITVPDTDIGGASTLIGGVEVETQVTRENNELRVIAGSISARIWAIAQSGGKVPLDADGRLRLQVGDSVTVDVNGLDASTPVEVRLYSDPLLLGRSQVDASGTLGAAYEIPSNVTLGNHTVVMVGTSNNKEVTLALSIAVGEDSAGINVWVIVIPIGLAVLAAVVLPVALRRRRLEAKV